MRPLRVAPDATQRRAGAPGLQSAPPIDCLGHGSAPARRRATGPDNRARIYRRFSPEGMTTRRRYTRHAGRPEAPTTAAAAKAPTNALFPLPLAMLKAAESTPSAKAPAMNRDSQSSNLKGSPACGPWETVSVSMNVARSSTGDGAAKSFSARSARSLARRRRLASRLAFRRFSMSAYGMGFHAQAAKASQRFRVFSALGQGSLPPPASPRPRSGRHRSSFPNQQAGLHQSCAPTSRARSVDS